MCDSEPIIEQDAMKLNECAHKVAHLNCDTMPCTQRSSFLLQQSVKHTKLIDWCFNGTSTQKGQFSWIQHSTNHIKQHSILPSTNYQYTNNDL